MFRKKQVWDQRLFAANMLPHCLAVPRTVMLWQGLGHLVPSRGNSPLLNPQKLMQSHCPSCLCSSQACMLVKPRLNPAIWLWMFMTLQSWFCANHTTGCQVGVGGHAGGKTRLISFQIDCRWAMCYLEVAGRQRALGCELPAPRKEVPEEGRKTRGNPRQGRL